MHKLLQTFLSWREENKDYLRSRPNRVLLQRKLYKAGIDVNLEEVSELKRLAREYDQEQKNSLHYETQITKQAERISLDVTTARNVWVKSKPDENGISASFLCKNPLFNEQGFDFEEFKENLLKDLSEVNTEKLPLAATKEDDTLLVFSLPDLHIGKVPTKEIELAVYAAVNNLFSRFNFEKNKYHVLFIMGNDLLNSDFEYRTTKGTPQFDVTEYYESFVDAIKIVRNVIETIKEHCTVSVINIPGNHDRNRGFYLGEVINAYYNNLVDNTTDIRKYYKFGKTLLGFDHGELKAEEYPLLMATEKPLLFSETSYHEWFLGHLHGEQTKEVKGFKMRYLPSLTHHRDQWHVQKGYVGNKRCAMIYKYDFNQGLIGSEVYNFS
jgi:hypothetical protein